MPGEEVLHGGAASRGSVVQVGARSTVGRIALTLTVVVAVALLAAGCGSSEGEDPAAAGPTVAPMGVDGTFDVDHLLIGERDVPVDAIQVDGVVAVTIDAEFGGLRIITACGVLLGSYSLLPDGDAGMTVAGGSSVDCTPAASDQRDTLVAALGRVTMWDGSPEPGTNEPVTDIDLTSPAGDVIALRR